MTRDWLPWSLCERMEVLEATHKRLAKAIGWQVNELMKLEARVTNVEQQTWDELGRLVGVIVAEVQSLRDGIAQKDEALRAAEAALADVDSRAADQVTAALEADSASDVERVNGLAEQLKSVVPAEVPDVPVPPVGEPAEAPAEGESPA